MNSNTDKSLDSYGKGTLKNDNDDTQSDDAEPPSSEIDVLTVKINGDPKNTSSEQNSDASNNAYKGHKERKARSIVVGLGSPSGYELFLLCQAGVKSSICPVFLSCHKLLLLSILWCP